MSAKHDKLIFEFINDQNYRINENGTVQTLRRENGSLGTVWRDCQYYDNGYAVLKYQYTKLRIHRIVWAKFKGYLRSNLVINHIDGNKSNNAVENLELVTESTNQIHAYRSLGHKPRRGAALLSWEKVDQIRNDWNSGAYTQRKLAEKYQIARTTAHEICAGKKYQDRLREDEAI